MKTTVTEIIVSHSRGAVQCTYLTCHVPAVACSHSAHCAGRCSRPSPTHPAGQRAADGVFQRCRLRALPRFAGGLLQEGQSRGRAWLAMPNHGHLILVPGDADGLRAALAPAHRAYAGLIHARHKPKDDRQARRHRIATGVPFSSITTRRSLSAFPITLTELRAMAAAAIMGDKRMPKTG